MAPKAHGSASNSASTGDNPEITMDKDIIGDIPQVASGGFLPHVQFLSNFKRDVGQIRSRIAQSPGDVNALALSSVVFDALRYMNALHRIRKAKSITASLESCAEVEIGRKLSAKERALVQDYVAVPVEDEIVVLRLTAEDWRYAEVTSVDATHSSLEVRFSGGDPMELSFATAKNMLKIIPKAAASSPEAKLAEELDVAYKGFKAVLNKIEKTSLDGAQDLDGLAALKARAQRHREDAKRLQAGEAAVRAEYARKLQEDIEFEKQRMIKEESKLRMLESESKKKRKELNQLIKELKNEFASDSPEVRRKRLACRLLADEDGELTIQVQLAKEDIKDITARIKDAQSNVDKLDNKTTKKRSSDDDSRAQEAKRQTADPLPILSDAGGHAWQNDEPGSSKKRRKGAGPR